MPWPVAPNPPRELEPPELVDVVPPELRPPEDNAVETEVGPRLRENHPPDRLGDPEYDEYECDEYEFQRQPLHERRRHGSAAAAAGAAPGSAACGGLSVVVAAGAAGRHSGRGGIM
jgi:hypothetical protein